MTAIVSANGTRSTNEENPPPLAVMSRAASRATTSDTSFNEMLHRRYGKTPASRNSRLQPTSTFKVR